MLSSFTRMLAVVVGGSEGGKKRLKTNKQKKKVPTFAHLLQHLEKQHEELLGQLLLKASDQALRVARVAHAVGQVLDALFQHAWERGGE